MEDNSNSLLSLFAPGRPMPKPSPVVNTVLHGSVYIGDAAALVLESELQPGFAAIVDRLGSGPIRHRHARSYCALFRWRR